MSPATTPDAHEPGGATPSSPTLPVDSDYSTRQPDVVVWSSPDDFASATGWAPGVHVVMLPSGTHVDLFISGDIGVLPSGRALPVVFSGAVSARNGSRAPFFSGASLGRDLGTPLVSISDPLLAAHDDLRLGWYTGAAHDDVQGHVGILLHALSERVGHELLLVGGSGGGFAALHQVLRADYPASALVWNPQTDLLDYDPPAVAEYLAAALGRTEEQVAEMTRGERSAALVAAGIEHRVLPSASRETSPRRVVYLQNASDWHVAKHLAPFLEEGGFTHAGGGRWSRGDGVLALVSAMAAGHSAPPRAVLEQSLSALLDTSVSAAQAVDRLQAAKTVPSTGLDVLPRDLRPEMEDLASRVGLSATLDHRGTARAALVWNGRPNRYGGVKAVFELLDAAGTVLLERSHADNMVQVPAVGEALVAVRATLRDGFGHVVLTRTEPVQRLAQPVRVLVVGSCVSRDTFEFLDPDHFTLQGYVARQSLVSSFAPGGEPHFDLSALSSAFQRRMLDGDARSSLPGIVAELADEVDLVLWDLVDERLGLLDHDGGHVTTDSVELRQARLDGQAPSGPSGPAFGSPEHLDRFRAALPQWRSLLEDHGLLSRTVLVAPPWAAATQTGEPTPSSFGLDAERANELTQAYLDAAVEVLGVKVLGRGLTGAVSHTDHQWGPAPFHYDDTTYLALAGEVASTARSLCAPWGWESLQPSDLTRVPTAADRDPRREAAAPEATVEQTGSLELTVRIHGAGSRACSFSVHQGSRRIEATPYLRTATHSFTVPEPGIYRCRVFVLTEDGERLPVTSPPLRVT